MIMVATPLLRLVGIVLIFPAVAGTREPNDESRIIGGRPALPFEFPFYVYAEGIVEIPGGYYIYACGGSLVARDVVLSVSRKCCCLANESFIAYRTLTI